MLSYRGTSRILNYGRSSSSRIGGISSRTSGSRPLRSNHAARVATPMSSIHRGLLQSLSYSTERIVSLRSGKDTKDIPKTMYRPDRETENCGVGLVASLKSAPSRKVVEQADEMLVRMSHRGGCGCDPASGDGAGKTRLL